MTTTKTINQPFHQANRSHAFFPAAQSGPISVTLSSWWTSADITLRPKPMTCATIGRCDVKARESSQAAGSQWKTHTEHTHTVCVHGQKLPDCAWSTSSSSVAGHYIWIELQSSAHPSSSIISFIHSTLLVGRVSGRWAGKWHANHDANAYDLTRLG